MRGGERVVEVLCRVFPQADLFTLTWDPARLSPALAERRATTSAIHSVARAPFVSGHFRALLPLFPLAVEAFKLDEYDLIVSSSHCVAIGAIAPPTALHIAYVHSTIRYVREAQSTYEASVPGGHVGRALFRGTARYLRRWETAAAARPHDLIANSTYTRDRIRRYYQRDALVIEPPIETGRFERAASTAPVADPYAPFLVVSALVPNKRVELALRAFQGRSERLVVVGEGPERKRLEHLAGPNVTLLPRLPEADLAALYASCRALLHPGVDDFGMVMVEALAAGKPVLACAEGGALDIVQDGETGLLIEAPTVESVRAALDRFARVSNTFDPRALRGVAKRFDSAHFERRFAEAVEDSLRRRRETMETKSTNGHQAKNGYGKNGSHGSNGSNGSNGHASHDDHTTNGGDATHVVHPTNGVHGTNESHTRNGMNGIHRRSPKDGIRTNPGMASSAVALPVHCAAEMRVESPVGPWAANHSKAALATKRFLDVTLATSGLVVTAPLVMALGAVIPLASPGPALFFQERTGLDQRPFTLVKLRTMDDQGQATRLGRWLRPLGLDELPQLWNVLKGDMSLVGPRPELPNHVARYASDLPGYRDRHRVRPGITGWAQVNGLRGNKNVSIADRLHFDLQYLTRWSLALDARILVRTFSTVIGDTIRSLRG